MKWINRAIIPDFSIEKVRRKNPGYPAKRLKTPSGFFAAALRANFAIAKFGIIVILILSNLITASEAFEGCAYAGGKREGHGYKEKKEAFMRELNLTPEQDKLLKDVKAVHRGEMKKLFEVLKAKRTELKDALAKPDATKTSIAPIVAEIKKLQAQLLDGRVEGIFKIKAILTPEQFQKLESLKNEWREKARTKHGRKDM